MCIAIALAAGAFSAAFFAAGWGVAWSIVIAVIVFMAFQIAFGMTMRKRMLADMARVQKILLEGQKKLQQKVQRWQMRPPGSMQAAQREIAEDTKAFVGDALAETERLRRFKLWVPMIERQIATAQVQLCWMIKDFKKVDELMPKVIMADPQLVAMKLARLQMLDAPLEEIAKVYAKGVRRLRYNQNVLLAACYSWILVKRDKVDDAFKVLTEALKSSDNETLKRNHEELMNNRVAHFNNSGLGDQWYSLHLEEPRMKAQRQRPVWK